VSVLPAFDLDRPVSLSEALSLISEEAVPYNGGTELLLAMRAGFLRPDRLVDLKRIPELKRIEVADDQVIIGGGATHDEASGHDGIRATLPVLAETLSKLGNPRVRAAGTLGGNLCFAEPKSDVATVLMALDASVRLLGGSPDGTTTRDVPVAEFIVGPYTTTRTSAEILSQIRIPVDTQSRMTYMKYQTMERPTVGVAVSKSPNRTVAVIGAIGPIPEVFQAATLDDLDPETIAAALDVIEDLTGADDYKRHIAALLIARAIEKVAAG